MPVKPAVVKRSAETRQRILDVAEQRFATNGFAATSTRALTTGAKVNQATLRYHFATREALIVAVFLRRLQPVNQERLQLLSICERQGNPSIEDILEAYIGPMLRLMHGPHRHGRLFIRLLGRSLYEPGPYRTQLVQDEIAPMLDRFRNALQRCLPSLTTDDMFWRMHFGGGALTYTMVHGLRLNEANRDSTSSSEPDVDRVVARLVDFIAAGMNGEEARRESPATPI